MRGWWTSNILAILSNNNVKVSEKITGALLSLGEISNAALRFFLELSSSYNKRQKMKKVFVSLK